MIKAAGRVAEVKTISCFRALARIRRQRLLLGTGIAGTFRLPAKRRKRSFHQGKGTFLHHAGVQHQ